MSTPNALATNENFEFTALNHAKNYRACLLRSFTPHLGANVLEVGAGIGQFSETLKALPQVKRLVAIEPDVRFHLELRKVVPEIIHGTVEDVSCKTAWNNIISVNVLEHIEDDTAELTRYHRLLSQAAGTLCLFVPARPEIYSPVDKDFGHFRRYCLSRLEKQLEACNFSITHIRYFNFLGYFAWALNFRLLRQRKFSPQGVWVYDRVFFPPMMWAEKWCRPPIGQSVMVIAKAKPGVGQSC